MIFFEEAGVSDALLGLKIELWGVSPGLVVMEGDLCSEGCWFKSHHHILDETFSHIFVVKTAMFVCKDENKRKEAGDGPFKNRIMSSRISGD